MSSDHRPSQRLVPRPAPDRSTPTLFDDQPEDDTIAGRFARFHAEHPEVYRELVVLARQVRASGRRAGIGLLWERLRWTITIDATTPATYKLNNVYRAHYARLIMANEPDLAGMFDTRELQSK